jgi:hypothetical protein
MMRVFALALVVALSGSALAASDTTQEKVNRYSMTPVEGGFLRLDTHTGAVSLCTVKEGAAQCRLAADERAALLDEIDRLRKSDSRTVLPSREELSRVWEVMEDFMRRMMRVMREEPPR